MSPLDQFATSLAALAGWIGAGCRSARLSCGIESDLPHHVHLVDHDQDRGEFVRGRTLEDALAQAAMVVTHNPELTS